MTNTEPLRCLKCNSRNISADNFEQFTTGYASRDVTCDDCGYTWNELFQFVGIEHTDKSIQQSINAEKISDEVNYVILIDTDNDEPEQYLLHVNNPDTFHTDLEHAVIGWISRMRARGSTAAAPPYRDVLLDFGVRDDLAKAGIRIVGREGDFADLPKDTIFDHLPKYSPAGKYRLASSVIAQLQNFVHKHGDLPVIPSMPGNFSYTGFKISIDEQEPAIHLDMYTY